MKSTATLNGYRVTGCRVQIPAWGIWTADVELDHSETLTGAVTLVLEDLTLVGTIMTGGRCEARTRYRIVGGAGGWGRTIAAKSYVSDLGVKPAKVLGDAASACGETLGTLPTMAALGPAFVRAEGPGARVLDRVAPRGWYVDEAGVTRIGRRAAVTFEGAAPRTRSDAAQGTIELAATAIATLLPGAVVDGVEAVDVEHVLDGSLRSTIWGRGIADTSRMSTAFERIVSTFTAHHKFYAPWEYRVVLRNGSRLDLQAVRVSSGMPDLHAVRVRGPAGYRMHPKLGSIAIVRFANGDPARPFVEAFDDPDSPGFIPDEVFLQAGATGMDDEGSTPKEHATSAEALVLALQQTFTDLATKITALGGPGAPLTVGGLAGVFTAEAVDAALAALVATMPSGTLGPITKAAIATALATKSAHDGGAPSIGWPKVRGS